MRRALCASALAAPLLVASGCVVDSRCQVDFDCAAGEQCSEKSGTCFVECRADTDCWMNGAYVGKHCLKGRCEFLFDERVAAQNFCLPVVNPRSASFGKQLCLKDLKGRVVLLYFAWLT